MKRNDGRNSDELRPVRITPDFIRGTLGSVLVEFGHTKVVCAASMQDEVPKWMRERTGWITSEYSMLPYASGSRSPRESVSGRLQGRTQEIQRLIGRSLRSVVNLDKLGERTLWVDCDVLQADGGTRTASVTGGFVALGLALRSLHREGRIEEMPLVEFIAGISVGVVDDVPVLDLCYEEDSRAEVDMNVVMTESGRLVEIQGTAESRPFTREELLSMLSLAGSGISRLIEIQKKILLP